MFVLFFPFLSFSWLKFRTGTHKMDHKLSLNSVVLWLFSLEPFSFTKPRIWEMKKANIQALPLLLKQRIKHKLKALDRQTLDILQCYGHLSAISPSHYTIFKVWWKSLFSKLTNFRKHEMFAEWIVSSPWCQVMGICSNSYRDSIILSSRFFLFSIFFSLPEKFSTWICFQIVMIECRRNLQSSM